LPKNRQGNNKCRKRLLLTEGISFKYNGRSKKVKFLPTQSLEINYFIVFPLAMLKYYQLIILTTQSEG
jgi:hypothetical protein